MGWSEKVNDLLIIELMITSLKSLDLSTYTINSVDKTELSCYTPTDAAPQLLYRLVISSLFGS